MRLNILFGGEAGQGPNILTNILGKALVKQGYYVFYSRDYQSLIRGGHNFNVLTFSDKPVHSNDNQIDILVALDANTETIHKDSLKKKAVVLKGYDENMYYSGRIFKLLGLNFEVLEQEFKELGKRFEENMKEAKKGYEDEGNCICKLEHRKSDAVFMNGNQGIAEGAVKSGLDIYYAYPMTPATPLLGELAEGQEEKNILVLELENELAIINAGIGSAMTGAKTMVGTSGGGFDLMTEALSLSGMAEVPIVIYLSQRPGPATGVATYTAQGDLNIARHSGHGEFNRVVLAPGDSKECQELISQSFHLSQIFGIPSIIISDKHLGESFYTTTEKPKITHSKKLASMTRYNSYEKNNEGSATEDSKIIKENVEARIKKKKEIEKEAGRFEQYKIYGKKNSQNVIVSWGSPKGAILDAMKGITPCSSKSDDLKKSSEGAILDSINDLDCEFLQILYIEPFPNRIKKELIDKNIILVENNATGLLGDLIAEKTGIFIEDKNKILRYDGRPFLCDELKKEIERRLK